jgi:ethanolaminephosphotransferase
VDALRSDFVYGAESEFHFTQSLIRNGAAIPFTGHASPPTITMPRVKAITTGSVPSFIDLILNFAESDTSSTLATQDSWLAQMKAQSGGKLVMFGDDTWLRLFPDFFARSDGTTSFFVSDFTEVDHNVTRNVPSELQRDDWSAMVLHYLGLDHIGHKTGPQGPNMPIKQREMDDIVKLIYSAMENYKHLSKSLLVLLGDHGMNEAGNHGASSAGETSTALTFISPKFKSTSKGLPSPVEDVSDFAYYDVVEQSDIAATLAVLLGFPIPKNSLGIIINRLLELWDSDVDRYNMLFANARQMQAIAKATFVDTFNDRYLQGCDQLADAHDQQRLACDWQKITSFRKGMKHSQPGHAEIEDVRRFLRDVQSVLSGAASKYDLIKMAIGIGSTLTAFILILSVTAKQIFLSGISGLAFTLFILIYSITMFASSYVEEEHQFWYWSTAAWLTLLAVKSRRSFQPRTAARISASIVTCLLFGISRRWNQTGQKHAGEPDIVTKVLLTNRWLLWLLVLTTYSIVSRRLSRRAATWGSVQLTVLPVIVAISALLFKLAFTAADAPELLQNFKIFDSVVALVTQYHLVGLARMTFLGLAYLLIIIISHETPWKDRVHKRQFLISFHDILSLFLITQTRTVNVPIFLLFYLQAGILRRFQTLRGLELTLTSLLMQHSSFFMLGGTNAISSVDLSNAYNGVSGYNVAAVGTLTFISNWAGPIWWTSASYCLLGNRETIEENFKEAEESSRFEVFTLFATVSTLAVMVACLVLREHLFIWTVFSPKYLYIMAWMFGQHFSTNGLFGSFILSY